MANARRMAVRALLNVERDSAYSNITLNNILRDSDADISDKKLATALFYGVLDRKITLDYILGTLTKTPFNKVAPFTAQVLRVALYQIMYMDKIPDSAAVNEAVKMVKNSKQSRDSGFVNAILRECLRRDNLIPTGSSKQEIGVRYSCPLWIIDEFVKDYGIETTCKMLEESLKPAPLYARVNTLKLTVEEFIDDMANLGIECQKTEVPGAVVICTGFEPEKNKVFLDGGFHIQDLSSQECVMALSPVPNERILDVCASPGGKSFTIAELMDNTGEVVSCDLYKSRVGLIENGAQRLGLKNITAIKNDAMKKNNSLGLFDAVLCDVPCSGLGIIRRKPDIKYKQVDDFSSLRDIQYQILSIAADYVKPGGRLVYSTCTVRRAENEEIVNRFLEENPQYRLDFMRTNLPGDTSGDGFFTALICKC